MDNLSPEEQKQWRRAESFLRAHDPAKSLSGAGAISEQRKRAILRSMRHPLLSLFYRRHRTFALLISVLFIALLISALFLLLRASTAVPQHPPVLILPASPEPSEKNLPYEEPPLPLPAAIPENQLP